MNLVFREKGSLTDTLHRGYTGTLHRGYTECRPHPLRVKGLMLRNLMFHPTVLPISERDLS